MEPDHEKADAPRGPAGFGDRIRSYRKARRLTLKLLAAHVGITESFLSQIERGKCGASVGTLNQLANALGLSMSDLFDETPIVNSQVLRRAERPELHAEGVTKYLLTRRPLQNLEVLEGTFEVGASTGGPEYVHGDSQELVYVLAGTVKLDLGDRSYVLSRGDSVDFRSSTPHALGNVGKGKARALWMISPPTSDGSESHGTAGPVQSA
jgi:transcriptional regulator with XRE-family HTH domain